MKSQIDYQQSNNSSLTLPLQSNFAIATLGKQGKGIRSPLLTVRGGLGGVIFFLVFFLILPNISEAANRYWVGAAAGCDGTWADTDCWAATSNGAGAAGVPTNADDVFFDGVGNGASNSTLGASITINSLDMTGYTNTLTHAAAVTLTVDGNGVNFKLASGMTYTLGSVSTSAVTFTGTSGTTLVTTAGKQMGPVTVDGVGGTVQLQDDITINSAGLSVGLSLKNGTLDTNGKTVTTDVFNSQGSATRTLTMGSSAINVTYSGGGSAVQYSTATGLTVTANTATITVSGTTNANLSSINWNGASFVFTGATPTITPSGATVANLTRTGNASKTDTFIIAGNITVTGTLTINGNSSTNRVLVYSSTLGTARTITAATVSVTNADFMDITGAGAGNWDLSAITGLSGDAGGNSGITFTTADTMYWTGNSGSWSVANQWCTTSGGCADNSGDGRVPLPQDDVVFDNGSFSGTSQTVTGDMPRIGKSIDWSAYNEGQTPTWTQSQSNWTHYGSFILNLGVNYTFPSNHTFAGRGSFVLTTAGKTIVNIILVMVGGTLTFQDAVSMSGQLDASYGTINANGFNFTAATSFTCRSGVTLNMGSGTWTASSNWDPRVGCTVNAQTSTIVLPSVTASAKTFSALDTTTNRTYNNVIFSGDNITVSGSSTFNNFALNNAGLPTGLLLTSGTTQTVTSFSSNASLGRIAKLLSSSAGSAATISDSSGMFCGEYLSIKDSTVSGGASWYASNSTNVSGNTGWTFSACPAPNTGSRTTSISNVRVGSSAAAGGAPSWYSSGGAWSYRKRITIDHNKVATTSALTNFPTLFSVTDPDLRFTGHGGKVASSTGLELVFTSSDGTTKLDYELEHYASTTGETVAWVEVPSLSGVTDTTIYVYFGGNASAINTDQTNKTGVWSSNYGGVWHMNDNAANTTVTDSTSNLANGTNAANTDTKDVTGKVDGSLTFNGSSDYVTVANNSTLNASTGVTMSAWVRRLASGVFTRIVNKNSTSGNHFVYGIQFTSANLLSLHINSAETGVYFCNGATAVTSTTEWYYVVTTYSATGNNSVIYLNGVSDGSGQPGTGGCGGGSLYSGNLTSSTGDLNIARLRYESVSYFGNAELDEVRVSNVARGADWVTTEYNNQSFPSKFYSYGGLENYNGRVDSTGAPAPVLKTRGGVKFR